MSRGPVGAEVGPVPSCSSCQRFAATKFLGLGDGCPKANGQDHGQTGSASFHFDSFTLIVGGACSCLCKAQRGAWQAASPLCVAACGYDYHGWHGLFMNRLTVIGRQRRMPMRNRRPSRFGAQAAQQTQIKERRDQTLVWPFLVL